MPGPKPPAVELTTEERGDLEGLVRRHKTGQQLADRARIVLLAAAGKNNSEIARELVLEPDTVRLWRQRMIPVAWETLLQGGRRELLRPTRVAAAIRGLRHGWAIARRGLSQGHPDH